jgi:dimeric dUTPase (all-alpha-NTP-PPase superfamily)
MDWLNDIFKEQIKLQKFVKNKDELSNPVDMYNASTSMIVEIGEMLQCDTRWKEFVNNSKKEPYYNATEFAEELCDVFIYFMNILIYSGTDIDRFKNDVTRKQTIVKERFNFD